MAQTFKSPREQFEAMLNEQTDLTPEGKQRLLENTQFVKNYSDDKYNEIVDFITENRDKNVPLGNIQNQLLKNYGPDYEDLVRHAISKWAE